MTEISEEIFRRLVHEVVRRVVLGLGADGSRGSIAVVLTGATSGFTAVPPLLRRLVLDGFRLELAFSPAARLLYGETLQEALAGFPHVSALEEDHWLTALKKAKAVVVPLLSVNTLSKLASLIADTLPGNLLLHGLFMDKPVLAAIDGVHPDDKDRKRLGLKSENTALRAAVLDRLATVARYGCILSDLRSLYEKIHQVLDAWPSIPAEHPVPNFGKQTWARRPVITATDIRLIADSKGVLTIPADALLTPLARELAEREGLEIRDFEAPSNRKDWP